MFDGVLNTPLKSEVVKKPKKKKKKKKKRNRNKNIPLAPRCKKIYRNIYLQDIFLSQNSFSNSFCFKNNLAFEPKFHLIYEFLSCSYNVATYYGETERQIK